MMLYFTFNLIKNTVSPLKQAIGVANTIAAGDLTHQFAISRTDEFGELSKALKQMNVNLRATVLDITRMPNQSRVTQEVLQAIWIVATH